MLMRMEYPDSAWAHLAAAVRAQRLRLGLTQQQAAAVAGVSKIVWGKVENAGQTSYRDRTLVAVEQAMGWAPGSVEQILAGGQPTLPDPDDTPPPPAMSGQIAAFSGKLHELTPEQLAKLEGYIDAMLDQED